MERRMQMRVGFLICFSLALMTLILLIGAAGAQSYDDDPDYTWVKRYFRECDLLSCYQSWRWQRVRRGAYYGYRGYYGSGNPDRWGESGAECQQPITNVSQEHQSEENAKEGAIRNWQSLVRFHFGEKYISIENAREVRWMCSQSSVADSASSKVGAALGIIHYRCEIIARPCRPNFQKERGR